MAKRKKTQEEIDDDNERTNSAGLFNSADGFWVSAKALQAAKVKHGHAISPVQYLYYHAIELYLKSLLRQKYGIDEVRTQFGHNTLRLVGEAENLGMQVMEADREVFSLMGETDAVIESRYLRTGSKQWPTFESLDRTCKSLRGSIGRILGDKGVLVRV